MSLKWTGMHSQSETGILRKSEFKEKKEELFVFGYSCKLFRDDAKALHIDQGKHLIPWMGEETLKIDRYDARGALHELSSHEAPQGGFDWRVELNKVEHEVEQLCDEERYRALHTDEEEELMYKEEELKRLHKAGYGQVGFNYETPVEPSTIQPPEVDEEPFIPSADFKDLLPIDTLFPESLKQNAIIEKTSKFIATQGAQMEILIKAKQRDNPQFKFLNREDTLHPYYTALTALVKAGKWPEKKPEIVEEKPPENEEYLHPSLASTIIESAPSIPSIQYKPSADCDYTMLVSKMRGDAELAPGELPPPGTEPAHAPPPPHSVIASPPVLYNTSAPPPIAPAPLHNELYQQQQYALYYQQYMSALPPPAAPISSGLSLMKNYDSATENSESEDDGQPNGTSLPPPVSIPPDDVKLVVEKMAAYVARNGDEFADIVRAKNDPRFTFLEPTNVYHAYYARLMREKRGDTNGVDSKNKAPVSFSIKKLKEPDPILPRPALPYETSSEDDEEKTDRQTEKQDTAVEQNTPQVIPQTTIIPQVTRVERPLTPTVIKPEVKLFSKPVETKIEVSDKPKIEPKVIEPIEYHKPEIVIKSIEKIEYKPVEKVEVKKREVSREREREASPIKEQRVEKSRDKERDSPDRRREKKRNKNYRSKSEGRDYKRSKSSEREKKREQEIDRKKRKAEELESEIISLEDNSDDMIDLTGDQSDSKGEGEETDKTKQLERRRRAAEFLKKVGVDPAAAALPTNSLASAMVDTLESIRKKKAAEEEKRRRKVKRRRRERRYYEELSHRKSKRRKYKSSDDDENSCDGSKKKKRKKEKKHSSKSKKKRRHTPEIVDEDMDTIPVDLTNTLKELRTNSPTKNLIIPDVETNVDSDESREEKSEEGKEKKRVYSEGEWSSDSEGDSCSIESRD